MALAYLGLATAFAWMYALYYRRQFRARRAQPGAAVRSVLREVDQRLRRHSTALLLFVVAAVPLAIFGERGWWADLPLRLWAVLAAALLILHGYALARLVQLVRYRARLAQLLDQHEDIHVSLAAAQARGYRLHHGVPAGELCLDMVGTGENGIYALTVMLPPAGAETAVLKDGRVHFGPGGQTTNIVPLLGGARVLARELYAATGLRQKVHSVIIVPGCRTESGSDQACLLVNSDTCVSFIGWRTGDGFLMAEDRQRIDTWLEERLRTPNRAARRAVRATLGETVPPPLLV